MDIKYPPKNHNPAAIVMLLLVIPTDPAVTLIVAPPAFPRRNTSAWRNRALQILSARSKKRKGSHEQCEDFSYQ